MKRPGIIIGTEGAQGAAMAADAVKYAEKFRDERILQYNRDRTYALRKLDPEFWRVFSWRWNLCPPYPRGWGAEVDVMAVMHKTRLMLDHEFTEEERRHSAKWCYENGIKLPDGLEYDFLNDKILGKVIQPEMPPRR